MQGFSSRLGCLLLLLTAVNTPLLSAPPAVLTAAPSPCSGNLNIVRVSDIRPGMMPKFLEAVAAQKAWYKKMGMPDEISLMRVMVQDPATKSYSFSETQALTGHIEPASRTGNGPTDAGYDAFVAMFKDSSTIKYQYVTCIATM